MQKRCWIWRRRLSLYLEPNDDVMGLVVRCAIAAPPRCIHGCTMIVSRQ